MFSRRPQSHPSFGYDGLIRESRGCGAESDETADVGMDGATPVTEDYAEGDNEFTGKIKKVTVELK